MRYITETIKFFTYITTGIVIVFIVILLLNGDGGIYLQTLIGIPCCGLITAIVTVLAINFYPTDTRSKAAVFGWMVLHYLVLCGIMCVFGCLFGWIGFNIQGILHMAVSTAAVYAFTYAVAYLSSKNDADELNRALKNKHSE